MTDETKWALTGYGIVAAFIALAIIYEKRGWA